MAEYQSVQKLSDAPRMVSIRYNIKKVGNLNGYTKLSCLFKAVAELMRTEVIQSYTITRSTLS